MLETVKKNGGKAELHIFEGEGHGWRQAKTIRKALERELEWYQGVFNGTIQDAYSTSLQPTLHSTPP